MKNNNNMKQVFGLLHIKAFNVIQYSREEGRPEERRLQLSLGNFNQIHINRI
jgi:hypothetical protein